jgi:inhibitor of KinA
MTEADTIVPLGDQAALVYLDREDSAVQFGAALRQSSPPWVVDVVQAYTSVAVFFDLDQVHYQQVAQCLWYILAQQSDLAIAVPGKTHIIPCSYEFQRDLPRIAEHTGLPPEEIIRLHTASEYTVCAIGFCPGFPYLGYLPPALTGVPRLESPRVRVEQGSVGLTGRQTGIYTLARPGGWNLIGRTPLQLVDVAEEYFPLRTGDRVRFRRIDEREFQQLEGERL